jgi:hypothetical protein
VQQQGPAMPGDVRYWIAIWAVFWAVVFLVAWVPAVRPAWEASVPVHRVDATLLVSDPITSFVTPYISFARSADGSALEAGARILILSGSAAVTSAAELTTRRLIETSASDTTARQFGPSSNVRLVISGAHNSVTGVTVGYDGRSPVIRVIWYWWPWLLLACLLSLVLLAFPFTWQLLSRATDKVLQLVHHHRPILWLMVAAAFGRLLVIFRGGQYFDWDESRYGGSAAWMFSYLSTGNFDGALGMMLKAPDHPGFRAVGLVPAFFHVASAWPTSRAITDMGVHNGEWLPAFLFSLGSVGTIGLTYALANRSGASRSESFLAAFLMFASSSMLSYARHFFPYDISMATLLCASWIGLDGRRGQWRSLLAGFLVGLGFLTYEGYWALAAAAACLHVVGTRSSALGGIRRAVWFSIGAAICPGLLALAAARANRPFITAVERFARTAVNGDFNEGWSLPWAYLWHAEHALLVCYLVGIAALVYVSLHADQSRRSAIRWLGVAAGIYCSLIVGATVLHRFVVYDRLARQMLPFICLAAAAGFSAAMSPRFQRVLYVAVALAAVPNWVTVFAQRFPRDIAIESVRQYGANHVGVRMTISGIDNATVRLFLPFDDPASALAQPRRYILTNAQDIWVPGGASASVAQPDGKVLLSTRHPRQLKSMQYHGYQPAERTFLRSIDFPIQLIDTQPDQSTSSR